MKIQGDGLYDWGCTVLISDFVDVLTASGVPADRTGVANISNIQIDQCGQMDTMKGSIRFEQNSLNSYVHNSVITNSLGWAAKFIGAQNVDFDHNVVFKGYWKGLVAHQSENLNITDNIVLRILSRDLTTDSMDAPTGFFICAAEDSNCINVYAARNRAIGNDFSGFLIAGTPCTGS